MAEEEMVFLPDCDTVCNICYAEFLDVEDLNLHVKQLHNAGVRCKFCSSVFSDLSDYCLHLRDNHLLNLKCCGRCTKIFTNYDDLRKHQKKHLQSVPKNMYKCSQCKFITESTTELQQHEFENHNNNFDGIFINDCLTVLSSHLGIKAISFIQSLGYSWTYDCPKCKYSSSDPKEYINHLKETKCQAVVCDLCSNIYSDVKNLIRHVKKCSTNDVFKVTCEKCDQEVSKDTYIKHVKQCKPIKCRICNLKLESVHEMTQHQREIHPMAITMTTCQFCHKEFVGNVTLNKHIERSHKKFLHLYKYRCVYCVNMVFMHPKQLFAHFYSTHIDLQPFSCKICNETFRVRKKFSLHIKLKHNSIGFVEFDEDYHVHFTDKKSENPFQPQCLFPDEVKNQKNGDETDIDQEMTDIQTDAVTDVQTDAENKDEKRVSRKPPKIRFKEEKRNEMQTSATDQAGDSSYKGKKENQRQTQKRKFSKRIGLSKVKSEIETDISDEEPLSKIRKKVRKKTNWNLRTNFSKKQAKKKCFTCNICDKYCYTYQNYNFHVATHYKNEAKSCVKCFKKFLSTSKLEKHMQTAHSKSRLTEHLQKLLEKKKRGICTSKIELPQSVRFLQTITKVESEPVQVTATITEVTEKLSVQKFIENFTPEEQSNKKNFEIETSVSVKTIDNPIIKPCPIKMTKFVPKPMPKSVKLAMPVKFKNIVSSEKPKVTVRLINHQVNNQLQDEQIDEVEDQTYMDGPDMVYGDDGNDSTDDKTDVPDVAQEVMLESQEPPQKQMITQIVIPKIDNVNPVDIKIAHLLPEAPYYKITKLNDILCQEDKKTADSTQEPAKDITLPSGRKLVSVNPLAHLIGDTPLEKYIGAASKKYQKKNSGNYESAVAQALLKLETFTPKPRKKKGKQTNETSETLGKPENYSEK